MRRSSDNSLLGFFAAIDCMLGYGSERIKYVEI
jgi:hypothetical protein